MKEEEVHHSQHPRTHDIEGRALPCCVFLFANVCSQRKIGANFAGIAGRECETKSGINSQEEVEVNLGQFQGGINFLSPVASGGNSTVSYLQLNWNLEVFPWEMH